MKYTSQNNSLSTPRPDWTYSVQAPPRFSFAWILGYLASLSIPLAGAVLLVIAAALGLLQQS